MTAHPSHARTEEALMLTEAGMAALGYLVARYALGQSNVEVSLPLSMPGQPGHPVPMATTALCDCGDESHAYLLGYLHWSGQEWRADEQQWRVTTTGVTIMPTPIPIHPDFGMTLDADDPHRN